MMRMVTRREGGGVTFFNTSVCERDTEYTLALSPLTLSGDLLAPGDPPAAEPAQHRCESADSNCKTV